MKLSLSEGTPLFFSSDWHWNHRKIIKLAKRPFTSLEEMQETIVKRWNERVPTNGIGILVGDTFMSSGKANDVEEAVNLLESLNGTIYVMDGNHDHRLVKKLPEKYRYIPSQIATIKYGEQYVEACHYPMVEWNRGYHGSLQVFGHTHQRHKRGLINNSTHIGVDSWDFCPVSLEEVNNVWTN